MYQVWGLFLQHEHSRISRERIAVAGSAPTRDRADFMHERVDWKFTTVAQTHADNRMISQPR